MAEKTKTPADIYREELRALKARQEIIWQRSESISEQITKVRAKLEECEKDAA